MSLDADFARLIEATPEQVFDAFTSPDGHEAFYGQDDPGWIVRSQCDLRVGGEWTVTFGPSPRELYAQARAPQRLRPPGRTHPAERVQAMCASTLTIVPPGSSTKKRRTPHGSLVSG
jgi:uncharacterized protein YndB with AHSA1/START domain